MSAARILKGQILETKIDKSIGEYFFESAEKYGDSVCQINVYTGEKQIFSQVLEKSKRVAIFLQNIGIKPKDVVLHYCHNDLNSLAPVLACFFIGIHVCAIDPSKEFEDVKHSIELVEPKVIFVAEDVLHNVENALNEIKIVTKIIVVRNDGTNLNANKNISQEKLKNGTNKNGHSNNVFNESYYELNEIASRKSAAEKDFEPLKVDIHETAAILFSSGTTSLPKGICLSHYALMHHAINYKTEGTLGTLIQFTSFGWITAYLITTISIYNGLPKVVGPKIDCITLLEAIHKHKVCYAISSVGLVKPLVNLDESVIKKYDVSSFKAFAVGATYVDPKIVAKLRKIFPWTKVVQAYGSTETSCGITQIFLKDDTWPKKAYESKLSSVGFPGINTEVKVVDIDNRNIFGPNQEGEILVKGPQLMQGYFKYNGLNDLFDEEGFLKTGDLGYYDEDGYLYVTDRLNETFKYYQNGPFKISPSIIEGVLSQHPDVNECAVIGIPHYFDVNHPAAAVVLKEDSKADLEEILKFVNERVQESHKLRGGIKALKELPKTSSMKIQRRSLRELFLQAA